MSESDKAQFLKDVHEAVYGCILGAFVQGLEIITKASKTQVGRAGEKELMAEMGCVATRLPPYLARRLYHPIWSVPSYLHRQG